MHWSLPQDCLQPTSSDITYQNHTLWLRAAHDPLIFENVVACVELANWEGKNDKMYSRLEPRSMRCPVGAERVRIDPHSVFGRAPFEVQSVDSGWLLEHSNGAPLGYVHAQWAVHSPQRPELDPTMALKVNLHEIMVRPSLQGHGFGGMMLEKVVDAVGQHVDLLLASHGRLRGLPWNVECIAETISSQGGKALRRLEERINAMLEERTQPGYLAQHSFALRG